ncbi:hypothetical protein LG3211_3953 [Lysobacter gummosus]|nr:hypothetical protein LG3211_3953 [Lysobacter gummosus]
MKRGFVSEQRVRRAEAFTSSMGRCPCAASPMNQRFFV